MFTGIIEQNGRIENVAHEGTNVHFTVSAQFASELQVDQSVAHDGVCLTVVKLFQGSYVVTAIQETMERTSLGQWKEGSVVNLERCTQLGGRLDGHLVQGHVDTTAILHHVQDEGGSWVVEFTHEAHPEFVTVPKGSITVNGISLTVVDSKPDGFSVAIIPYTWEHTNLRMLEAGDRVNLEFDVIGKYVARVLSQQGRI
ncbi:MAG: riboflavin synthase [Flavobacteriales bacterium]|jgi:riboflavin synthase|nr:riboflavin synthase [Flavobacteriales bacterium]